MKKTSNPLFRPARYRFEVGGRLDKHWSDWFDGSILTSRQGKTVIISALIDQSGLHGLIARLRDLGLPIISLHRLEPGDDNVHEKRCCDE